MSTTGDTRQSEVVNGHGSSLEACSACGCAMYNRRNSAQGGCNQRKGSRLGGEPSTEVGRYHDNS